jgi:replicative DNA helicase
MTDQVKAIVKSRLSEYLNNITTRQGSHYICPMCGSGLGANKTAAGSVKDNKFSCFSCGKTSLDTIDLIAEVEKITQAEAFNRAYEIFNISKETDTRHPAGPTTEERFKGGIMPIDDKTATGATQDATEPTQMNYTEYISKCEENLKQCQPATDYLRARGLSDETTDRYNLGYDTQKKQIIIPYDKAGSYYIARNIDTKEYYKAKGPEPLYNLQALYNSSGTVFITEGQIDSLSIIEAGAEAVAINGTGFIKLLTQLKKKPTDNTIILSLDNDRPGIEHTAELERELKALNISYKIANISGQYKDPNEALTADKTLFLMAIQEAKAAKEAKEIEREEYYKNNVHNHINEFLGKIKDSINTPAIATGFKELDKVLDGGLYEGLYIIGAISSLGKTSFILQMADQIAQNGQDVLIFSLEMARAELMAKSISRTTFLECNKKTANAKTTRGILSGAMQEHYSHEEKQLISDSINKYASYAAQLYISEGLGTIGVTKIGEAIKDHYYFTGNKPVVIIDYLQILAPADPRSTDKQNTDKAVFELKRLSREYKIPVMAISSLNRDSYTKKISMAAFKESGAIEYSSDVLIGLQFQAAGEISEVITEEEKGRETRKIELKILKNRNGKMGGQIKYDYIPMFNYFKEE